MSELYNVTYCGLHCKLCATKSRIPQLATGLRNTLAMHGWESFGESIISDFVKFWAALNRLAEFNLTCPDCREGCGDPGCEIRKCATKRKVTLCPFCEEYPCKLINTLA